MKIKTKLLGIISILIFSLVLIGGSSIFINSSILEKNTLLKDEMALQNQIKHVQYRLAGLSNDERGFIITGNQDFADGMEEKADDIFSTLDQLESLIHNPDHINDVDDIRENFDQFWSMNQEVVSRFATDPEAATSLHLGEERTLRKEVLDPSVNAFVDQLNNDVSDLQTEIDTYGSISKWSIIFVTVISIILGIVLSILLLRSILVPLRSLNRQLEDIAQGDADLTQQVIVRNKDEFGQLAGSFNAFVESLAGIVKQISNSSQQVAAASEELSASSEQSRATSDQISESMQDIAKTSTNQSTMTEKSSASITEILESLSNVASNTNNIAENSSHMKNKAEMGASSVNMMSGQMTLIDQSVREAGDGLETLVKSTTEISNISSLITDISAQTNLLALNAAIEAARAGEQGKGFAVVADEVRKLADEANQSASTIKQLVSTIETDSKETVNNIINVQQNVDSGMNYAHESQKQFNEILNLVGHVTAQIQEVAAATQELTAGVEVIQHTLSTLETGTKETSSSSKAVATATQEQLSSMEDISNAAVSLSDLAEELQEVVNRFTY
ncbi:methyl-accepting chemotaxis protein [Terribacillus saccharophilus]|uniref:methyl-accepting chemotaxis protein n=1 Tax=Terribacillus saccharophilus TaxID=361277 RepID=UPI0039826212